MMQGDEGFTIIEALTALAILAVLLVVLYGAGAVSLRNSTHIANVDRAILLAQSKLDEIAAMRATLPEQSQGRFPGSEIGWSMTAETIPDSKALRQTLTLQRVHLSLLWRDGIRQQSLSVETRHLGAEP